VVHLLSPSSDGLSQCQENIPALGNAKNILALGNAKNILALGNAKNILALLGLFQSLLVWFCFNVS
jgi:hypothetical protein